MELGFRWDQHLAKNLSLLCQELHEKESVKVAISPFAHLTILYTYMVKPQSTKRRLRSLPLSFTMTVSKQTRSFIPVDFSSF